MVSESHSRSRQHSFDREFKTPFEVIRFLLGELLLPDPDSKIEILDTRNGSSFRRRSEESKSLSSDTEEVSSILQLDIRTFQVINYSVDKDSEKTVINSFLVNYDRFFSDLVLPVNRNTLERYLLQPVGEGDDYGNIGLFVEWLHQNATVNTKKSL